MDDYRYMPLKFWEKIYTRNIFIYLNPKGFSLSERVSLRIDERKKARRSENHARAAFMLIPINSGTIVAVIIEATTTDRKSHARRLAGRFKNGPFRDSRTHSYQREEKSAHLRCTHARRSYTVYHCWCVVLCCRYSRGEPSHHMRQGRPVRLVLDLITDPSLAAVDVENKSGKYDGFSHLMLRFHARKY